MPFLASLFARGLDFEERFDERLREFLSAETYDELYPEGTRRRDNTNRARVVETMRLLAPVMRASWLVMHNSTPIPLVLNDRGLAAYLARPHLLFYGFPLTPRHMLVLHEGAAPQIDYEALAVTSIRHREMTVEDVHVANANVFRFAINEVYGPTAPSLAGLGDWAPEDAYRHLRLVGPDGLVPGGYDMRFHEGEWWERIGRIRARRNRMPRKLSVPVVAAIDLPMSPAHNLFMTQLALELCEQALAEGRGEEGLDHCSEAAQRDPAAVREWVARRLALPRFGRRHGRSVEEVADSAKRIVGTRLSTAFEACGAAIQLALIEAGRGHTEDAQLAFRRAAVTSRDYETTTLNAATVMVSLDDMRGAADALQEVANGNGKRAAEAMCRLGELLAQDTPTEASRWFARAIETGNVESSSRALFRLGDLSRVERREAATLRYYAKAEKFGHATWSAAAFYHHGVYLTELGRPRQGLRMWRRAFEIGHGFWKATAGGAAGRALLGEDRAAEAIPYLRYSAASPIPRLKDFAAYLCGLAYMRLNDLNQARFWFARTSVEASDELAEDARLNLADVANRQDNREESLAHIRWVADRGSASSRAKAALWLGYIVEGDVNSKQAVASYEEAIELGEGPVKDHAMFALATMLEESDPARALGLAVEASGSTDRSLAAKAANLAGLLTLHSGDVDAAGRWFGVASDSNDPRQSPIALANHGGMLLEQGTVEKGLRLLKTAQKLQGPGAVLARLNLADYWERTGHAERAERELKRTLAVQDGRYESLGAPQYAQFLSSRGRISEARRILEHAVLNSSGRRSTEVRDALDQLSGAVEGESRSLRIRQSVRVDIREEPPRGKLPTVGEL